MWRGNQLSKARQAQRRQQSEIAELTYSPRINPGALRHSFCKTSYMTFAVRQRWSTLPHAPIF